MASKEWKPWHYKDQAKKKSQKQGNRKVRNNETKKVENKNAC